jgi:hypothetical protein
MHHLSRHETAAGRPSSSCGMCSHACVIMHHIVAAIYGMHTKVTTIAHSDVIDTKSLYTRCTVSYNIISHVPLIKKKKLAELNETSIHCYLTTSGMYVTNTITLSLADNCQGLNLSYIICVG